MKSSTVLDLLKNASKFVENALTKIISELELICSATTTELLDLLLLPRCLRNIVHVARNIICQDYMPPTYTPPPTTAPPRPTTTSSPTTNPTTPPRPSTSPPQTNTPPPLPTSSAPASLWPPRNLLTLNKYYIDKCWLYRSFPFYLKFLFDVKSFNLSKLVDLNDQLKEKIDM